MYVDARDESFRKVMEGYPFLSDYTAPMKRMERPLVGREHEMRSLKAAFNRAELSNVMLLAEAGSGKAIADDELLPVADARGYIRMGDVSVGDIVFGREGEPVPVTGVFPQGNKRAYLVRFTDGSRVVCNDEHIWRVRDVRGHYRDRKKDYFNITLAKLIKAGFTDEESGACRWWVPANEALQRPVYEDAVRNDADRYGSLVAEHLDTDPDSAYALSREDFEAFLYADEMCRRKFLDPIVQKLSTGVSYDGRVVLRAGDGELMRQLKVLFTSIGVRVFVSEADGGAYELKLLDDTTDLGIESVEDMGIEVPMTCIKVGADEELFQVTEHHIVTHNTALVQGAMDTDEQRIYLEVDLPRMIADTPNPDQIADKLKRLFEESGRFGKDEAHEVVLFMDEFHQIVQISAAAVEALKPLLADSATRGIHVVAATTYAEFQQYVSGNQPLVERLQRINLREVDRQTTVSILSEMARRYGVSGSVADEGLYDLIYEYTNRYIPANAQPRKSILVLDAMIGWHRSEGKRMDTRLLADVIYESEGVNVAFRVDPGTIKKRIDEKVFAQDYATSAIAQRLQLCVADLNDKSKPMSTFLMTGSTGVGKCCTNDTPVPVIPIDENGIRFKLHGDLEVGDVVVDAHGNPTNVLGVFPRKGVEMYRVELSDGRYLDVGDDHLWAVYTAKMRNKVQNEGRFDMKPKVMTTREMLDAGVVRTYPGKNDRRHMKYFVPMNGAVEWPEREFSVDPYVVGAFIGNGCMTQTALTLSGDDMEVIERVCDKLGAIGYRRQAGNHSWCFLLPDDERPVTKSGAPSKAHIYLQSKAVMGHLDGLYDTKSAERRIPAEYMTGSVEQRFELVRGLFDTDGSVSKDDRCRVSYSTFSRGLAEDIVQLLFSLGISAKFTEHSRSRVFEDGRERQMVEYTVRVRCDAETKPRLFYLKRKVERARKAHDIAMAKRSRVKKFDMVGISDIYPIGVQDAQCIYVDNDEHLYQAGQFVVTHNTEVTKQMAGILFGDAQRHLIRLDMTEYANPDSLERFRLELTTRVWERPYCIILLDEVEKACAEVTRILLSVLDDARLTDRNGRTVTFNNAYIVLTTNAGSEIYKTIAQYESSDTGSGEFLARYEKLIRRSLMATTGDNRFPPELLGRVDCIVPFQPLSEETMRKIVLTKLQALKLDLWRKHQVEMAVAPKVVQYLVEDSLDTDSDSGGARAVVSKLESEVTTAVARFINVYPDISKIGVKVEGEMASDSKDRVVSEAYIKVVGTR